MARLRRPIDRSRPPSGGRVSGPGCPGAASGHRSAARRGGSPGEPVGWRPGAPTSPRPWLPRRRGRRCPSRAGTLARPPSSPSRCPSARSDRPRRPTCPTGTRGCASSRPRREKHQSGRPFGVRRREQEAQGTTPLEAHHHRPGRARGVHDRAKVVHSQLERQRIGRCRTVGDAEASTIEGDHPRSTAECPEGGGPARDIPVGVDVGEHVVEDQVVRAQRRRPGSRCAGHPRSRRSGSRGPPRSASESVRPDRRDDRLHRRSLRCRSSWHKGRQRSRSSIVFSRPPGRVATDPGHL